MKKNYITPTAKVQKLATSCLLAGSEELGIGNTTLTNDDAVGSKERSDMDDNVNSIW